MYPTPKFRPDALFGKPKCPHLVPSKVGMGTNLFPLPPCSPHFEPGETAGTFEIRTELGVIKGHP